MNRLAASALAFSLSFAFVPPATAQETGTVTIAVTGVHSGTGNILASLCDQPSQQFPGTCMTYTAMAKAIEGTTTLAFPGVKPGSYALQVFHDEDGNMYPTIPPEGFAFGNDQQYPPDFARSSIKVAGNASHTVKMSYMQNFGAAPAPIYIAFKGQQQ